MTLDLLRVEQWNLSMEPVSNRAAVQISGAILGSPDFLFLQAAMEPLDVAVAFWMMVGRAAMRDAK
jgi:hypothetical protein